jgi:hypothetical protein
LNYSQNPVGFEKASISKLKAGCKDAFCHSQKSLKKTDKIHASLSGGNRADADKPPPFKGLQDCQNSVAVRFRFAYAPEHAAKIKCGLQLPALPVLARQTVPKPAGHHDKRRTPALMESPVPGSPGKRRKRLPPVHIKFPAHSLSPPQNPQIRFVKPGIMVFLQSVRKHGAGPSGGCLLIP